MEFVSQLPDHVEIKFLRQRLLVIRPDRPIIGIERIDSTKTKLLCCWVHLTLVQLSALAAGYSEHVVEEIDAKILTIGFL